jgi:hypothetical protein
MMFLN